MFGIDQISWGEFTSYILAILLLWYSSLITLALYKQKSKKKELFESTIEASIHPEGIQPISVLSSSYPSEMVQFQISNPIPLPVPFYEEIGIDDGYGIEHFVTDNSPVLSKLLDDIQFQQ